MPTSIATSNSNLGFLTEAEQLRQKANGSLLAHFAEICDGVVVVDKEARIAWMNDKYPKRLGIPDAAAVIGKPIETVIPNSLMREVVTTGRPMMLDIMDFGSDTFVVMRFPLRDDAGQIIGAVGFLIFDDAQRLTPIVSRYQKLRTDLADAHRKLAEARQAKYTLANFIGTTPVCTALKQAARRAARTSSSVLILGETGTGKELLAQAIHASGPRADGPFVAVNIAAIPETLLEAEFFGVAAGAYTGADQRGRDGKFKLADGGTLFLDEIGDMSLALQSKFLRTLQEREFEPVGSNRLISVDVRVIAATHHDLEAMVRTGRFRSDLYYRLNVIVLKTPPLRQRLDDLPILAEHLIDQLCRRLGIPQHGISPGAVARLRQHAWPGNVRELSNVLERALLMSDSDMLETDDLDAVMPPPSADAPPPPAPAEDRGIAHAVALAEADAICDALRTTGGNKSKAAKLLGISRAGLYEKIAAHGIVPPYDPR